MYALTFLEAKRPLVKQFSTDGVTPYPMVKRLKTHHTTVDPQDTQAVLDTFQTAASKGYALLKGHTKKPLQWESRAGQTDASAYTSLLVIDIDGLRLPDVTLQPPFQGKDLEHVAEKVVALLPAEFHNISYLAHASASFGLKRNSIHIHLFFFLDAPVAPRQLRPYLTALNFNNDHLLRSIQLSGSGRTLTYALDPCLADNSRMIFIGHPRFQEQGSNPFPDNMHRIIAVTKRRPLLNLDVTLQEFAAHQVAQQVNQHIRRLRDVAGLPNTPVKHQQYNQRTVISNPSQGDEFRMHFYADHGEYVTYNVGDGDSHAYYVRKDDPHVVWNFKGETPFVFQAADPETYEWHIKEFGITQAGDEVHLMPFAFRDIPSDSFFSGLWNPAKQEFEYLNPTQRANIDEFIAEKGGIVPDRIPQWHMTFDPTDPRRADFVEGYLNTYKEPDALRELAEIPPEFAGIPAQEILPAMEALCPNIHIVVHSLVGSEDPEYIYFLNWLAYALQRKTKTGTAWLFHGTQGTGKGLFIHEVLMPLMDHRYVEVTQLTQIEDQFNSWMETAMFVCVDEIRVRDSAQANKVMNKLKNYITEPTGVVRLMRQNPRQVKLWANFLFFTNERDPLQLAADDRRFNVGVRQEHSLKSRYGPQVEDIRRALPGEIPRFASLLAQLKVDDYAATTPLENIAKRLIQETSEDSIDAFVTAVMNGDLEYFMAVMEANSGGHNPDFLLAARNLFRSWLRDFTKQKSTKVWTADLLAPYNILVGRMENDHKFSKLMGHRGIVTKNIKRDGVVRKGIEINWRLTENDLAALHDRYLGNVDKMDEARNFRPQVAPL